MKQVLYRFGLVHPRRRLNESLQRLDDLRSDLCRCAKQDTKERQVTWQGLAERLARVRPTQLLKQRNESVNRSARRLQELGRQQLRNLKSNAASLEARLTLLEPEQVLGRGYSITTDAKTGKVLRDANQVKASQRLKTRLKKGEVFSRAEN